MRRVTTMRMSAYIPQAEVASYRLSRENTVGCASTLVFVGQRWRWSTPPSKLVHRVELPKTSTPTKKNEVERGLGVVTYNDSHSASGEKRDGARHRYMLEPLTHGIVLVVLLQASVATAM